MGEEVFAKEKNELVKSLDEIETQLNVAKLEADENVKLKEKLSQAAAEEQVMIQLRQELAELNDKLHASENQRGELEFLYQESVAKLEEKQQKAGGDSARQVSELEFALEEQKVAVQELETKLAVKSDELNRLGAQLEEAIQKYAESETLKVNLQIELEKQSQDSKTETNSLQELENKLTAKNDEVSRLGVELNEIKQKHAESEKSRGDLQAELEKLSQESKAESNSVHELEKQIGEKSTAIERLTSELESRQKEKEKEMSELNESIASLQNSIKIATDKLAASEQHLDEAKKLNGELQARISELIQNSGDNSAQLNSLNENLQQKEK